MLEKYGVELIGANIDAIHTARTAQKFKERRRALRRARRARSRDLPHDRRGASPPPSELGYPVVVRPSFTMGGLGSGIAYDEDDLRRIAGGRPARLARPPRCCSRSRSSAGRSTSWR